LEVIFRMGIAEIFNAAGLVLALIGAGGGAFYTFATEKQITKMYPGPQPLTADMTEIHEPGQGERIKSIKKQNAGVVTGFSFICFGTLLQMVAVLLP
jgi:hypothetical protein